MSVSSIAELRKLKKNLSQEFTKKLEKSLTRQRNGDSRFWQPTFKDDKAKAIIRFLPAKKGEEDAIVCVYKHFFRGPNGVYSETSRITISKNENDPAQEYGWKIFGKGTEKAKEEAKNYLAKERYIANIYVIKDENAPENEGKVFLYEMPKTIAEMILEASTGDEEDGIEPKNVFGFWEAHNFILDVYKEGNAKVKFPKYNKCKFSEKATDLLDTDDLEEYEKIWEAQHSLYQFIDPENIKSYDELKKRLHEVLGKEIDNDDVDDEDEDDDDDDDENEAPISSRRKGILGSGRKSRFGARDDDDDDDGQSYRSRLKSASDDDDGEEESDTDDDDDEAGDDEEASYYSQLARRRRK